MILYNNVIINLGITAYNESIANFNVDKIYSTKCHIVLTTPLKMRISFKKRESFRMLLPLLRHTVPLNDGNCRLTIPVVKGRCARDALPHAFHIGVSKFIKTISTAI